DVLEIAHVGHAHVDLATHPWTSGSSDFPGYGFGRVDAQRTHRLGHGRLVDLALIRQRPQRRERNEVTVHFEVAPQRRAAVRSAKAIGAQRDVASRYPLPDL